MSKKFISPMHAAGADAGLSGTSSLGRTAAWPRGCVSNGSPTHTRCCNTNLKQLCSQVCIVLSAERTVAADSSFSRFWVEGIEAKTSSFLFMGDLGVPPSCPTRACVVVVRSCIRAPSRKRLRESLRQQIPCRVVCCHRADAATDADADAAAGGNRCYALTNRRPAAQSTCTCRPL